MFKFIHCYKMKLMQLDSNINGISNLHFSLLASSIFVFDNVAYELEGVAEGVHRPIQRMEVPSSQSFGAWLFALQYPSYSFHSQGAVFAPRTFSSLTLDVACRPSFLQPFLSQGFGWTRNAWHSFSQLDTHAAVCHYVRIILILNLPFGQMRLIIFFLVFSFLGRIGLIFIWSRRSLAVSQSCYSSLIIVVIKIDTRHFRGNRWSHGRHHCRDIFIIMFWTNILMS